MVTNLLSLPLGPQKILTSQPKRFLKKNNVSSFRVIKEFRVSNLLDSYKVGMK